MSGLELTPDIISKWTTLQEANPVLANPFFSPQFTAAVASVREGVEIAVLEERGEIVGFFPFQRQSRCEGVPVGEFLSDYQGVVCARGFRFDPIQILRACNLKAWRFDHLLTSQADFLEFHQEKRASPVIDLGAGYEVYVKSKRDGGSNLITQALRKARKLEREVGPLRFEEQEEKSQSLELLFSWKSRQYQETGARDLFATPWVRQLIENIHSVRSPEFSGVLSVLYAGDMPVAAHMGMRSRCVLHYWFPAYDRAFYSYSPGILLLLNMARAASRRGMELIDLGRGEEVHYKQRMMSRTIGVAAGTIEASPFTRNIKKGIGFVRSAIRRSPLAGPVRATKAWLRVR